MVTTQKPNEEKLSFVIDYFRSLADKQHKSLKRDYGVIEFMYKDLEEGTKNDDTFDKVLTKPEIANIMKWFREKGYARRLQIGRHKNPSVWDIRNLLEDPPVEGEPDVYETEEKPKLQVDLVKDVKEPEATVEYKVEKKDNTVVLARINESINDMIGYLQALPAEMSGELRGLSRELELADHNTVLQLTKEKEDLKDEVSRLKEELEGASSNPEYSEHYIYRQRNLIIDEVQRMLHAPAWSVRQNKDHYQNSIIEKLDNIMSHLNIKEEN